MYRPQEGNFTCIKINLQIDPICTLLVSILVIFCIEANVLYLLPSILFYAIGLNSDNIITKENFRKNSDEKH